MGGDITESPVVPVATAATAAKDDEDDEWEACEDTGDEDDEEEEVVGRRCAATDMMSWSWSHDFLTTATSASMSTPRALFTSLAVFSRSSQPDTNTEVKSPRTNAAAVPETLALERTWMSMLPRAARRFFAFISACLIGMCRPGTKRMSQAIACTQRRGRGPGRTRS